MTGKTLARIAAVVFVAFAITATAIEMTREEEDPVRRSSAIARPVDAAVDPLRDEMFRCQGLGETATRDPACLRAWTENRRRFLAPGARSMERLPDPAASNAPGAQ